jgi:hypothetical protein
MGRFDRAMLAYFRYHFCIPLCLFWLCVGHAQPITGVWRGTVQRGLQLYKLELKLVKKGDSLVGTSYYYASATHYYRYRVKGYFDAVDNAVHWWDDTLLAQKTAGNLLGIGGLKYRPFQSTADFNCPGGGIMRLTGSAETDDAVVYKLEAQKMETPRFADEWDAIIEGYFYGAAHPAVIDSVAQIARIVAPKPATASPPILYDTTRPAPVVQPVPPSAGPPADAAVAPAPPPPSPAVPVAKKEVSIAEKYRDRQKRVVTTLPVAGDSIVLQFYDNAEVDGDSVSLFLNDRLLLQHIRLGANAFTLTLYRKDLAPQNTLAMVAENLGAIPPNTSFVLAYDGSKRYSAQLESTEGSSAVIVLQLQPPTPTPPQR